MLYTFHKMFWMTSLSILGSFLLVAHFANAEDDFIPLFNGKDLAGWQPVNTATSTWSVRDNLLVCSGKPIGELRTTKMYQNFILEVEWRHMKPKGNAGIFVWADDITAKGVPFHRSIEVQVLENDYGNSRGHTTHGDIFPIHGAKMTPVNGRGGSRAFPTENRSLPSPQWNHYRIECRDGEVSLAVNGKLVTQGKACSPRKGYICIESEGGIVHYRNMRIKELPATPLHARDVAISDRGYRSIYDGINLSNWTITKGTWKANDWRLNQSGSDGGIIQSEKVYTRPNVIVDFKTTENLPDFNFAGQAWDVSKYRNHLAKGKGWNRLEQVVGNRTKSLILNGQTVVKDIPLNASQSGKIQIKANGPTEFANLFVRPQE
jgi:hypothetical protein